MKALLRTVFLHQEGKVRAMLRAALKHGIRNPESGIRKRNHGNGITETETETESGKEGFKIIIIMMMMMMMMIIIVIIINKTEKIRL